MTLRSSSRRLALITAATLACLIVAGQAHARLERLRWTHPPSADLVGFEAWVRALDGSNPQNVSMSLPNPVDGIYETSIEVGDGDVLISIRALGAGGIVSSWSSPPQTRLDPSIPDVPVGPGTTIAPTPGAAHTQDFNSEPIGTIVGSWVDTRANHSLVVDDSLFRVTELGSNQVLHTGSTDDDIHSHAGGSGEVWTNFELRGRLAIGHPDASIGVTTYSQYNATDAYYRLGRSAGGAFVIEGRPALSCAPSSNPVTPQAGDWYRFELDVEDMGSSNQIRAKVWRQGDSEPSSYTLSCVDSSAQRAGSGRIGVWSGGSGDKYWDDFEVILGVGSTPSVPPAPPVLIQVVPVAP